MKDENFIGSKLFYITIFVFMVACVVFIKLKYAPNGERPAVLAEQAVTVASYNSKESDLKENELQKAIIATNRDNQVPDVVTVAGTPSEAESLIKWRESRGRFSAESLAEYSSYDFETLNKLADGGDLKAMMVLADYYISERNPDQANGSDNAMRILIRAAIHGSTHALENYSEFFESKVYKPGSVLTNEQMIEVLAWKNVAALRGDMFPNQIASNDVERLKFVLNAESAGRIRQRSQEIYAELQKERTAIGLGDFDNSQPPEAKKFFSHLDNYMDQYNK